MTSSSASLSCISEEGSEEGSDEDWIPVSSLASAPTVSTSYSLIDDVGSEYASFSLYNDELNGINMQWTNLKAHVYIRLTLFLLLN